MAPPRAVSRSGSGYVLHLGRDERTIVVRLLDELREMLQSPATPDALARLFPVVHPDEPEREAEYQRLMRDELVTSRLAGIDTVTDVLERPGRKVQLDEGELLAFVQAVNSIRLVLGTVLERDGGRRGRPPRRARRSRRVPPVRLPVVGARLVRAGHVRRPPPLIWAGCSPTTHLGGNHAGCRRARRPGRAVRGRTSRWNGRGPVLTSRCSQPDEAPLPPSSSGRGHHPFKVAARVRIPLGVRTYMPLVPW